MDIAPTQENFMFAKTCLEESNYSIANAKNAFKKSIYCNSSLAFDFLDNIASHPEIDVENIDIHRKKMSELFSNIKCTPIEIQLSETSLLKIESDKIYFTEESTKIFSLADIVTLDLNEQCEQLTIRTISRQIEINYTSEKYEKIMEMYNYIYKCLSMIKDFTLFDLNLRPINPGIIEDIKYCGGYPHFPPKNIRIIPLYNHIILQDAFSNTSIILNMNQFAGIFYEKSKELENRIGKKRFEDLVNINYQFKSGFSQRKYYTTIDYIENDKINSICFTSSTPKVLYNHLQKLLINYKKRHESSLDNEKTEKYFLLAKDCLESSDYVIQDARKQFTNHIENQEAIPEHYVDRLALYPDIAIENIAKYRSLSTTLFCQDQSIFSFKKYIIFQNKIYFNGNFFNIGDIISLSFQNAASASTGSLSISTLHNDYQIEFSQKEKYTAVQFYNNLYSRLSKIKDINTFDKNKLPIDISDGLYYQGGHPLMKESSPIRLRFSYQSLIIHSSTSIIHIPYQSIIDVHIDINQLANTQSLLSVTLKNENISINVYFSGDNINSAYSAIHQILKIRQQHPIKEKKSKFITVICEYCNGINTVEVGKDNQCAYCGAPIPDASKKKVTITNTAIPVEQLRQLKDLFDQGIITQEEFEAKKKQLLSL